MNRWLLPLVAAVLVSMLAPAAAGACGHGFLPRADLGLLQADALTEASGLAASRRNPGVLWAQNDSGDLNRVFALNDRGEHLGTYTIAGATNRDWEDVAVGPGPEPGVTYLYIGDIGDNNAVHDLKYIFRVPEPHVDPEQAPIDTTLSDVETISFRYPDGMRDAETLMLDPLTSDLYVVSKREPAVRVYRAPYPQPVGSTMTLEFVASLAISSVVAGDISPGGEGILLKTYSQVFYWCRNAAQSVADAIAAAPAAVPYTPEPQGEAIAWDSNGRDYFTTSEEPAGIQAHLFVYRRPPAVGVGSPGEGAATDETDALPAPSPFRSETEIRYVLEEPAHTRLVLYSAGGRAVRMLLDAWQEAGERRAHWDGCDDAGRPVPAGVYYYALETAHGVRRGRVVLAR